MQSKTWGGKEEEKEEGMCGGGRKITLHQNYSCILKGKRKNLLYWLFSFLPVCKSLVIPVLGLVVLD